MPEIKKYSTAAAFRGALEERLKNIAKQEKTDIQKLRRQIAFDRFLARMFAEANPPWVLKGGYAMELRLSSARVTKDIDLAIRDQKLFSENEKERNKFLRELLQEKANKDLGDFFIFTIKPPTMDIDAAPYGGARFPVDAEMDGRIFGKFLLDIGIGDVWIEPLEMLKTRDWLAFMGVPTQHVFAIAKEQQFAEKLHAFTLPRENNSRVKDLVDMALLIQLGNLDKGRVEKAINSTFKRRNTHQLPERLQAPPTDWVPRFEALAKECQLKQDIGEAFTAIGRFVTSLRSSVGTEDSNTYS